MRSPDILSHAVRVALGLAMVAQTLPAQALDSLLNPANGHYIAEATGAELLDKFQQTYGHLSSAGQARAILTQSGALAIDTQTDTLYRS